MSIGFRVQVPPCRFVRSIAFVRQPLRYNRHFWATFYYESIPNLLHRWAAALAGLRRLWCILCNTFVIIVIVWPSLQFVWNDYRLRCWSTCTVVTLCLLRWFCNKSFIVVKDPLPQYFDSPVHWQSCWSARLAVRWRLWRLLCKFVGIIVWTWFSRISPVWSIWCPVEVCTLLIWSC